MIAQAQAEEREAAYALSVNINRRHMTKGQRAMVTAMAYPEPEQGKRATSLKINEVGVSAGYVRQARAVLRALPAVKVSEVVSGMLSLADAYAQALEVEKAAEDREAARA